jgi:hypothetical protein
MHNYIYAPYEQVDVILCMFHVLHGARVDDIIVLLYVHVSYKFWEMIRTHHPHNNYTHTRHIRVGLSVWAPPQCVLCECSCCAQEV